MNPLRLLAALALGTYVLITLNACDEQARTPNRTAAEPSTSSDEAQIRDVVADWVTAIDKHEYAKACALQTDRNTRSMLREINDSSGMKFDCPQLLEASTGGASADIDTGVTKVSVAGSTATAMVGMNEWSFAKSDGGWLISHLD